jgi:Uma2 family endonuclease
VKGPLYASSGFEEYWLVNVATKTVDVHRRPSSDGWGEVTRHERDESIAPAAFPDIHLRIADFLR